MKICTARIRGADGVLPGLPPVKRGDVVVLSGYGSRRVEEVELWRGRWCVAPEGLPWFEPASASAEGFGWRLPYPRRLTGGSK